MSPQQHMIIKSLAIALGIALADQLTKYALLQTLPIPGMQIDMNVIFKLVHVRNRGISFGLFNQDSAILPWLIGTFAVAVVTGLHVMLWRQPNRLHLWGVALISGGAIGNIVDRIRLGSVVDFLYFHWKDYYWPAFNVADAAICCGAALLACQMFLETKQSQKA